MSLRTKPIHILTAKFRQQQRNVSKYAIKLADFRDRRNKAFQLLQQHIHGFKPGDKVLFRGREKDFHGVFVSYFTDNESYDPKTSGTEEVLCKFNVPRDAQYNCHPSELKHDT